ncbi:MAG: hypothetical protein PHN78_00085 [Dehalococcoidales bacterium]|nr:hypothetical protein [Dehalococcoidales bacterium]
MTPQLIATVGAVITEILAMFGSSLGALRGGQAGAATIAEDPKQFRSVIVLAAMPLTQTFYALIVLLIVLTSVVPKLPETGHQGWIVFAICLITAVAELHSAYFQGLVCTAAITMLPKSKGLVFTPGILMAAYLELGGIVGMVFAIMSFAVMGLM